MEESGDSRAGHMSTRQKRTKTTFSSYQSYHSLHIHCHKKSFGFDEIANQISISIQISFSLAHFHDSIDF